MAEDGRDANGRPSAFIVEDDEGKVLERGWYDAEFSVEPVNLDKYD
jgi:hypothetical protein